MAKKKDQAGDKSQEQQGVYDKDKQTDNEGHYAKQRREREEAGDQEVDE